MQSLPRQRRKKLTYKCYYYKGKVACSLPFFEVPFDPQEKLKTLIDLLPNSTGLDRNVKIIDIKGEAIDLHKPLNAYRGLLYGCSFTVSLDFLDHSSFSDDFGSSFPARKFWREDAWTRETRLEEKFWRDFDFDSSPVARHRERSPYIARGLEEEEKLFCCGRDDCLHIIDKTANKKYHCPLAPKTKIKELIKFIRFQSGRSDIDLECLGKRLDPEKKLEDYFECGITRVLFVVRQQQRYGSSSSSSREILDVSTGSLEGKTAVIVAVPTCGYKHPKTGIVCTAKVEMECKDVTCADRSQKCKSCDAHAHRLFSKHRHTRVQLLGLPMTIGHASEEGKRKLQAAIDFFG